MRYEIFGSTLPLCRSDCSASIHPSMLDKRIRMGMDSLGIPSSLPYGNHYDLGCICYSLERSPTSSLAQRFHNVVCVDRGAYGLVFSRFSQHVRRFASVVSAFGACGGSDLASGGIFRFFVL